MKLNQQKWGISNENTWVFVKECFSRKTFLNKSCLKLGEIFHTFRTSNYMRKNLIDPCIYFPIVIKFYINMQSRLLKCEGALFLKRETLSMTFAFFYS